MDNLVLIAPPDPRRLRNILGRLGKRSFHWVYLGQSMVQFHDAEARFIGQGTYLDTTLRIQQAAKELREPYLAYIYRIGQEQSSIHWWLTTLSHRNNYLCKTLHQVCYLKVALNLANTWGGPEPLVVLTDRMVCRAATHNLGTDQKDHVRVLGRKRPFFLHSLKRLILKLAYRAYFVYRGSIRIVQSRRLVPRPKLPAKGTTLLISWATRGTLSQEGGFHQTFFGDLADRLNGLGYKVALVPLILRELRYKDALHRLQKEALPLLVPHRYYTVGDVIRSALFSLNQPVLPRHLPALGGMDIRVLVEEELQNHWVTNSAPDALLMGALVRRWARLGFSIARIIYPFENQTWERALCWETRRWLPGAALVGYQPTSVPRLLLNFYLAPGEQGHPSLPDRVVTPGAHAARLLSSDGYSSESVRVGGALQSQGLLARRSRAGDRTASTGGPTVLVASSIGPEEAAELVHTAIQLFAGDEGVQVVIKCHPMMPFERVKKLVRDELPSHVRVSGEPITDLMMGSSVMVYSSSSVGIQALALGLPAIHLRPRFDLDLDPLEDFSGARMEATGLEETRQAVRWLLAHREEYIAQHREEWGRVVAEMYEPVTEATVRAFVD